MSDNMCLSIETWRKLEGMFVEILEDTYDIHLQNTGEECEDQDAVLERYVTALRDYIYGHVTWYDYEAVFLALLQAVAEALKVSRKNWKPDANMLYYRDEIDSLSQFAGVAVFPELRRLNFTQVPNVLRARIIDNLSTFEHIRVMIIGASAGGQWMFRSVQKSVTQGMEYLRKIEFFSLKYDCTGDILDVLARRCGHCLKVLDVEGSKRINNTCLQSLLSMQGLEEIHIFGTTLDDESLARVLLAMPKLQHLIRGDFLCDALGWINDLKNDPEPIFLIQEFFSSQKYFFHEEWQLEMASRMCPYINTMLFVFHEKCVSNFMVLEQFLNLTELQVFGGNFFDDKLCQFLLARGYQLRTLILFSMNQVDLKAISIISVHCKQLKKLAFKNCGMITDEEVPRELNSEHQYDRWQSFLNMAKEAFQMVQSFQNLESVIIHSPCASPILYFILSRCKKVKEIHLGARTSVSDETMRRIFLSNTLDHLEEFYCDKSSELTMSSVKLLINNCQHLKAIGDLQFWSGIHPADLARLRQMVFDQNIDLDMSSHKELRKFLEMKEFERKTNFNLMAGPSKERIRRAQR